MTLDECTAILVPLALALRASMDVPTFKAYHQALRALPAPLLQAACTKALEEASRVFMPTAPELRTLAARARHEILAAHPFIGGLCCDGTGWRELGTEGRVTRCACYQQYLARLDGLGVGPAIPVTPERPRLEAGELFDSRAAQLGSDR